MNRFLLIIFLPLMFLLGGCSGGHMYMENDKDLELGDFNSINLGMDETEVVEKLGLPISYGIDEKGRNYLHYAEINTALLVGIILLPGVSASGSTQVIQGFEGYIYFDDDGKVIDVHVKEYQDE